MKRNIIITVVVVVLIVVAGVIALIFGNRNNTTTSNNTQELTKVRLNEVTRSVFYAPQYIAISEGLFKKHNLDVELTTSQGSDQVMTAVLSNQCDIGFAGPETSMYVYNEGKEDHTQIFAQLTKRDGSFLVSKTKQDNFDWNNLKGTTVIPGRKGGVPYMTLEYVIKKNGMDPSKDLVLDDSIKFDLMAGAFSAGNAEYVTLFEPTASMTQNAGKGYIVASVGEASGEIPYTAYAAKKSYIANNSKTIQGFTDAVAEGQKWVREHTAREIATSIVSFFPNTDIDLLETVVQRYKDIDVWNETPVMKEEAFNLLQTVMSEAGELKNKVPFDKVVNNSFALNTVK